MTMNVIKYMSKTVLIILLINAPLHGQTIIDYGSNQGEYLEVDNTKIYYEIYGEGHPVLLLHGGLGSISNFKNQISDLSKDFKVIAIDSPSHGRSLSIDSLSYNILAEYIVQFTHKLGLDKLDIIGYSDGAIIGLLVTNKMPHNINKLVFGAGALNPGASTPEGLKMLQSIAPEMLPKVFENTYKKNSPNPDHWETLVYNSKEMWLQDIWIPKEILPHLNSKVLILIGDRDPFIPMNHSINIFKALPNAELSILPNTYHDVFNSPEITNPILKKFLSKN